MLIVFIGIVLAIIITFIILYFVYHPGMDAWTIGNFMGGKTVNFAYLDMKYPLIEEEKKIYVIYHIGAVGQYKRIVKEQMDTLISSGLYDKAEILYGYNAPDKCDIEDFMNSYHKCKLLPEGAVIGRKTYENGTINAALRYLSDKDGYMFYFHSKGVTKQYHTQEDWRKYMMHWNVNKYETCIDILRRGFNTVGVCFANIMNMKYFYAGNFWWSRTEWFTGKDPIPEGSDRFQAEWFILRDFISKKHVCLWHKTYLISKLHEYKIENIPDSENNNILII